MVPSRFETGRTVQCVALNRLGFRGRLWCWCLVFVSPRSEAGDSTAGETRLVSSFQHHVRRGVIAGMPRGFGFAFRVVQGFEPVQVQAFIPEPFIERLDEAANFRLIRT